MMLPVLEGGSERLARFVSEVEGKLRSRISSRACRREPEAGA
jgi:hypothetical protein